MMNSSVYGRDRSPGVILLKGVGYNEGESLHSSNFFSRDPINHYFSLNVTYSIGWFKGSLEWLV